MPDPSIPHQQLDVPDAAAPCLPPPPPALDPRPSLLQTRLLLTLFAGGVVLFVVGLMLSKRHDLLVQRAGMFFAVYALVVAASWLPPSVLTRRVDAVLDKWVRGSATGYYGMMALATFTHLEMRSLYDALSGFELGLDLLRDAAMQWLVGFSAESMMNLVWGFAWPGNIFQSRSGLGPLVLVAATWAVFHFGGKLLPHANFQGPKRAAKKKKSRA